MYFGVFYYYLGEGGICPHRTVWKKNQTRAMFSLIVTYTTQKVIMLYLSVQGLKHPKLSDVLSDLWWYYELKYVTILAGEKNSRNKVYVYVFL